MDGQLLGGGVVVAVATLLWLVYLLPTWQSRAQYNAAERNAVRLNQALRVLAETSETPEEVRVELTAREASAKQKLAKQVQAEQSRLKIEQSRLQVEKDLVALEQKRREIAALRSAPEVRQAKARRRVRLVATVAALAGIALSGLGTWALIAGAGAVWLSAGIAITLLALAMLQRMAAVQARAARRAAAPAVGAAPVRRAAPAPLLDEADRGWVPRSLPAPLTATAGSRAQTARAEAEAREALRRAAEQEALRQRAAQLRPAPVPIETVRPDPAAASSPYARMGYVDDAEIEAHVRDLLTRRASA
ncbi:hypothetical protein E4U02_13680 [Microbacterium paludicola]|uniref:Large exoprotein n=2 Tax=Microbacterium paludicola TaxID=300019 RepID=A0A4Y9FRG9_9MICO|nr:hypothetical protein [Microbacterium paludicola]MBF0817456.1 hypothetical protein [Microbacterium paludicola]TFU31103.1 hypothetical protein E4U02_13680 [Microbacterium paludicola]